MLSVCTVFCISAYYVPQYVPYFVSLCITCPVELVCVLVFLYAFVSIVCSK